MEFLASVLDAARAGDTHTLAAWVAGGVPVNLTNTVGDTLLILSAYHDHPETVAALLASRPTIPDSPLCAREPLAPRRLNHPHHPGSGGAVALLR